VLDAGPHHTLDPPPPPGIYSLFHLQRPFNPTHPSPRKPPSTPAPRPQDIYSLFHLQRPFKFISKTSNFMIPIVGWSMFLTGGLGGGGSGRGRVIPIVGLSMFLTGGWFGEG
jgi:hypothetical protein